MRWLKILGLVLLIIVGAVSLLAWWVAPHVPSDQKLVKEFYKKRPDLERLVSMLADDSRMTRIAPDFLWTEDSVAWPRPESQWGISQVRWDEYKSLFRRAGVKGVQGAEGSQKRPCSLSTPGGLFLRALASAISTVDNPIMALSPLNQHASSERIPAVECTGIRRHMATDTKRSLRTGSYLSNPTSFRFPLA